MKDFVYEMHVTVIVPAESQEHAWAKIDEILHRTPFPVDIDWMDVIDEYDIDE